MGVVSEPVARTIAWLRPYGFLVLYALMLLGIIDKLLFPVQRAVLSWLL
jgi:hypothetical protein